LEDYFFVKIRIDFTNEEAIPNITVTKNEKNDPTVIIALKEIIYIYGVIRIRNIQYNKDIIV